MSDTTFLFDNTIKKVSDAGFLPEGTWLASRQYKIIKHIGAGGYGKTYLVETQFGSQKVVKELFIDSMCCRGAENAVVVSVEENKHIFKAQCEKFKEEAKLINKLSHPNVVKVSAIFEENNTVYYAMDYINGVTLKEYRKLNKLSESEILLFLNQLLSALGYLHSVGVSHLDIKPGNIMIDKTGRLVLIDFGSSKLFDSISHNKTMISSDCSPFTRGYAPAEQEYGDIKDMGPHCDIYAVGATLYYLYTGKDPDSPYEISKNGLQAIPEASSHVQYVITKAMAYWRKERIKSVEEFRNVLNDKAQTVVANQETSQNTLLGGTTIPNSNDNLTHNPWQQAPPTPPVTPPINKGGGRSTGGNSNGNLVKVLIIVLAAVAAFALGMGGYYLYKKNKDNATSSSQSSDVYQSKSSGGVAEKSKKDYLIEQVNGVKFKMVKVEGGTFTMGAQSGQAVENDEYPAHEVTLGDYYIGETEVTQELWRAVMNEDIDEHRNRAEADFPYSCSLHGYGDDYPMYYVSWDECNMFISRLNEITGKTYFLPTEAQWEYAARGGKKSHNYSYSGGNTPDNYAWFGASTDTGVSHRVKTKQPNELGLYDMSGNVWEWCSDRYGAYSSSSQTNPSGPSSGSDRVVRGGCWRSDPDGIRITKRHHNDRKRHFSRFGLRLALSAEW